MAELSVHQVLDKVRQFLRLDKMPATVRKGVVIVVGGICIVAGLFMVVFPGPAFVFIPLGFVILASEFKWAERWADKMVQLIQ
ncbi:MAG TPA: PGPGW domain-containing protein, partial [Candidatus Acidoferrum sp.]|nr:PGPGW domain-containing protein [Candidatus Acidoferrum sp.]